MSDSKKDAKGGHNPHGPGFEWEGKRALYQWTTPGRLAKQRASRVHRRRERRAIQEVAANIDEPLDTPAPT